MRREASEMKPPRRVFFVLSHFTTIGASQHGCAGAVTNVEMSQAPQPALLQHYVPPPINLPPPPPHIAPGSEYGCEPETRRRKLDICPLNGKELYQGLESCFLSWGKRFVRQISFAERESDFPWSEDVMVDFLGHQLTGMAERYYNRQTEGW